ncbi:relaxase, partial [Myroides odoratimimus]
FEKRMDSNETELHSIFEYLNSDSIGFSTSEYVSLFNLFDNHQEVDYEELSFEQKMKQRKKRKI